MHACVYVCRTPRVQAAMAKQTNSKALQNQTDGQTWVGGVHSQQCATGTTPKTNNTALQNPTNGQTWVGGVVYSSVAANGHEPLRHYTTCLSPERAADDHAQSTRDRRTGKKQATGHFFVPNFLACATRQACVAVQQHEHTMEVLLQYMYQSFRSPRFCITTTQTRFEHNKIHVHIDELQSSQQPQPRTRQSISRLKILIVPFSLYD